MDCDTVEFSGHAIRRMFERRIEKDAVIKAIRQGNIIEAYPDDTPYPSFLMLGYVDERPLHVVVGVDPMSNAGRIITVYAPEEHTWSHDFRVRRRT